MSSFKMRVLKPILHQGKRVMPGEVINASAEQVFDLLGKAVLVDESDLQRVAAVSRERELRFAAQTRGGAGRIGPSTA